MEIEAFVTAAQAGQQEALQHVGVWLSVTLERYFSRWFAWHDSDDLRQQTCVVVLRNFHEFEDRGPGSFRRWVHKIAHFEAKSRWRAPAREGANLAKLALLPLPSTLSLTSKLSKLELEKLVAECFLELTELEREVIMWGLDERDDHELAERTGVTVNALRTRRHRAREKLGELVRAAQRMPIQVSESPSPSTR